MKTFLKIFLGLIVFLILGITIFFVTFDLNTYKGMIVDSLSQKIGREVSVGSMKMKLSLIPTIKISDVKIQNPKGFDSDKVFVSADNVEATLSIVPLFSKKIEIRELILGTARLNMVEKNGKNNWTFIEETHQGKNSDPVITREGNAADQWLSQARVDSIVLKALAVSLEKDGEKHSLSIMDASFKQLKVFSLKAVYDSKTYEVSGTVNSLLDLIKQKPDYLFNMDISFSNLTAQVSGSIGDVKNFKKLLLNVSVTSSNLKQSFSEFGINNKLIPNKKGSLSTVLQGDLSMFKVGNTSFTVAGNQLKAEMLGQIWDILSKPQIDLSGNLSLVDPNLGKRYGLKPFVSHFEIKIKGGVLYINNISFSANRSDLQSKGKIFSDKGRPQLALSLKSEYMDLNDILASDFSNSSSNVPYPTKAAENKLFQDKVIDLSFFNQFDATVDLDLPHIKISNDLAGYFGAKGDVVLKDGILKIDPLNATLLNGTMKGAILIDVRSQNQKVVLKIDGTGLDMNLLKELHKIVHNATLDFSVDLTTTGRSVKSFISGLNGKMIVEVPSGIIVNKWFNSLPANMGIFRSKTSPVSFSTSDQESHIVCGALNINIKNGAFKSDNNMAIETSTANFLIGGDVDLNTEKLNLTMIPSLNNAKDSVNKALSAAQYVKITGTFSKPRASLDEEKVISHIARSGIEKLMTSKFISKGKKTQGSVSEDKVSETVPYLLCQRVLGRKTISQIRTEAMEKSSGIKKKKIKEIKKEPEVLTPREEFKKQFMESLSEVLQ